MNLGNLSNNNSSQNSKRERIDTKNKEKDEDFLIIDPTYSYIIKHNKNDLQNFNQQEINPNILELEILNSSCLIKGTKIKINQFGLIEGSLRNKKDNITYFGYLDKSEKNINDKDKEKEKEKEEKNNSVDYLLPLKHCDKLGRFFKIQFIPKINDYIIKDLGNGLGTFIKIQDLIYITNSSMINIGDSYLILYFIKPTEHIIKNNNDKENNNKKDNMNLNGVNQKLKIKLFESKNSNLMKQYIFDNNKENIIRIGRKNHGNQIELDDHLSSKVNSMIIYNNEKGWIIKDGNEVILKNGDIKRNYSTNGTWFLAIENIKIVDKLIFKSNFNIFKCNLIKN